MPQSHLLTAAPLAGELQRQSDSNGNTAALAEMAPRDMLALCDGIPGFLVEALGLEELFIAVTQ